MKAHRVWFLLVLPQLYALDQLEFQGGRWKNDIAPSADFGAIVYRHENYRVGAYSTPFGQGVVASYVSGDQPVLVEIGQRERSLEHGFLVGNGAWLPWSHGLAAKEPMGARLGLFAEHAGADLQIYQVAENRIAAARAHAMPAPWLTLTAGVASLQAGEILAPTAAVLLGARESRSGFSAGGELLGGKSFLIHSRYGGSFTLRSLAFRNVQENPLGSGIFANPEGFALQLFSRAWFMQFFSTDSRFGMLRYSEGSVLAAAVYEEKMQLAGFSFRNNPRGLHARAGLSAGQDGSMQTLAGLGFADAVFLGGGYFNLRSEQPLEPLIFPADWYSTVLLQSSAMRIRDQGFKVLALVDTDVIQGFIASTYTEDLRGREKFAFYARFAGRVRF